MTDFFSELERHLDTAARRQARLGPLGAAPIPRGRTVLALTAAVAVIALAVAGLPALLDRVSDDDIATGPTPVVLECAQDAPPQRLLDQFEVLRRDRAPHDELPANAIRALELSGDVAPVWTKHARLGGELGFGEPDRLFVVPVAMGTMCTDGEPAPVGLCLVDVIQGATQPQFRCASLERVAAEGLRIQDGPTFLGRTLSGVDRAQFVFLVPDGTSPAVKVPDESVADGFKRYIADVDGNVAVAEIEAPEDALNDATTVLNSATAQTPEPSCAAAEGPLPDGLTRAFAVLRRGQVRGDRPSNAELRELYAGTNTPDADFEDFLSVAAQMEPYLQGIRRLRSEGGRNAYLIPVGRLDSRECGVERDGPGRPGLCVTEIGGGRQSAGFCADPVDVAQAKAIHAEDPGGVYGLAPDGVIAVRIEWRDGRAPSQVPVLDNFVSGQVADGDVYAALKEARVTFVR